MESFAAAENSMGGRTLFPTDLPKRDWVHFQAAGFAEPICGVVYRLADPAGQRIDRRTSPPERSCRARSRGKLAAMSSGKSGRNHGTVSTILDALKRVEEQLRNEAGRKTAEESTSGLDLSGNRDGSPVQSREAVSGEDDEATKVYLSLVDMISRIQDRVQAALKEERGESRARLAELTETMGALQNDFARQRKTLQDEILQRDAEREAGKAALAAAQSRTQAEARESIAELVKAIAKLKNDFSGRRETHKKEIQQRDAVSEGGKVALDTQSLVDPPRQAQAETQESVAELARMLNTLRKDFACQAEGIGKENRQRDAEREAGKTALAAAQSQMQAETRKSIEDLAQSVATLRNEFARQAESLQDVIRQRDVEREAGRAALAAVQSQTHSAVREATAGLAQTLTTLQRSIAGQEEVLRKEIQQRDREREAGRVALATVQSQIDPLEHTLAETREGVAKLVQAMGALQKNLARHGDALQQEIQQRDAECEAGKAASTAAQSQIEHLKRNHIETGKTIAELSQGMTAMHSDLVRLRDVLKKEIQQRDAEREAGKGALAAAQSQVDALRQLLAERGAAVMHAQHERPLAAGPDVDSRVQDGGQSTGHELAGGQPEIKPAMDKNEAQRLHGAAVEAYVKGDFAEALRLLDIIDATFPDNKSILYNRAECLIFLGRNDEARELCDYLITTLRHTPARELKNTIKD